jgi:hypothetical protein
MVAREIPQGVAMARAESARDCVRRDCGRIAGLRWQRMRCWKWSRTRTRDVVCRGVINARRLSGHLHGWICALESAWPACEAGLARFTPRHALAPMVSWCETNAWRAWRASLTLSRMTARRPHVLLPLSAADEVSCRTRIIEYSRRRRCAVRPKPHAH